MASVLTISSVATGLHPGLQPGSRIIVSVHPTPPLGAALTAIARRDYLLASLNGRRADTLTHCPHCGDRAQFADGRNHDGHEIAGWLYEKPILTCPKAPFDRFVSVSGSLIGIACTIRRWPGTRPRKATTPSELSVGAQRSP